MYLKDKHPFLEDIYATTFKLNVASDLLTMVRMN
jgi:hypothetical protein